MEKLTIEQAINEISRAYAELENAKADCKDVVESALDAYFGEPSEGPMPKDEAKKLKASQKTEAKNIKKLAKAMAKGEKDVAREEAENMTELIESLG